MDVPDIYIKLLSDPVDALVHATDRSKSVRTVTAMNQIEHAHVNHFLAGLPEDLLSAQCACFGFHP
jgi:hypothetical protein